MDDHQAPPQHLRHCLHQLAGEQLRLSSALPNAALCAGRGARCCPACYPRASRGTRRGHWLCELLALRGAPSPRTAPVLTGARTQSYSGGRDLWGLHDRRDMVKRPEEVEKGFSEPIFDDGLLEVIGLKSGWHTYAHSLLTSGARALLKLHRAGVDPCCLPCHC